MATGFIKALSLRGSKETPFLDYSSARTCNKAQVDMQANIAIALKKNKGIRLDAARERRALELYVDKGLSLRDTAVLLNTSYVTVRRVIHRHGHACRQAKITQETRRGVAKLYEDGLTAAEIAQSMCVHPATVRRWIRADAPGTMRSLSEAAVLRRQRERDPHFPCLEPVFTDPV